MNGIFHALLNYTIISQFFQLTGTQIIILIIASTFIDLDHIYYLIKNWKEFKKTKKLGSNSRTSLHELQGLMIFSIILSIAYILFDQTIVQIIAYSIILHLITDFIVGHTRPLYPYSKKEVFTNIIPTKIRIPFEIITTIILGVIIFVA